MSKTGTVVSWRGPFGFAELEDGTAVYIHTDEIEGGRLRVGRTVKFDTEQVDGHDGKLKGTNVSGEAVLAKGAKLSDEDFAADKELRSKLKEKNIAKYKSEFDPVYEKVQKMGRSNQLHLLRTLVKDLGLSKDVNLDNEKRADPTMKGGKKFTKGEFIAFYGEVQGSKMWKQAAKKGKSRKSRLAPAKKAE